MSALLPRIRAAGADLALRDGRPVLTRSSLIPADLMAEMKARRDDLIAELANDNPDPTATQTEPVSLPSMRKRPVSWSRAAGDPQPGDHCGCCVGRLWWTETEDPKGWRCTACHPPAHLQAGEFRAVAT